MRAHKSIFKIVVLCFVLATVSYSSQSSIEQVDEPSHCRGSISSALSFLGSNADAYVFTPMGKVGNYVFTPEEKPTWKGALLKTSMGFGGILGSDQLSSNYKDNYNLDYTSYSLFTGLLCTGMREAIYLMYDQLVHPQMVSQARSSTKKYDQIIKKRDKDIERVVRGTKLVLGSGISLYSLLNNNNPGNSLSLLGQGFFEFLESAGINLAILETTLFVGVLVHNLNELRYFLDDSFLTYSPISEIGNGVALAGIMGLILGDGSSLVKIKNCENTHINFYTEELMRDCYIKKNPFEIFCEINKNSYFVKELNQLLGSLAIQHRHLDDGSLVRFSITVMCIKELIGPRRLFHPDSFNSILKFISYTNLVLCFNVLPLLKKNITEYILQTNLIIVKKEDLSLVADLGSPTATIKKRNDLKYLFVKENNDYTDTIISSIAPDSSHFLQEPESCRKKIKTIGVPRLSKISKIATSPISGSQRAVCSLEELTKVTREAALGRLTELRKKDPIKTKLIQSELGQATIFLKGGIFPIKGNIYSLRWKIADCNFSMNYEIPHASDSSNYRGNKRDRILSVLETCYLIGLNEESIKHYIEEHNLYNLYRLDKFMYFILFNRRSP